MITEKEKAAYVAASQRKCWHPFAGGFHSIRLLGPPQHIPTGTCIYCGTTAWTILEEQPKLDSPPVEP